MNVLDWFSFVSPNILSSTLRVLQVIGVVLILGGIVMVPILKRSANRWILEWIKEVRGSIVRYGATLLLLTGLSQAKVSVLGSRGLYIVLLVVFLWRMWKTRGRWKYWATRQSDEERKLQKLKYMPGR